MANAGGGLGDSTKKYGIDPSDGEIPPLTQFYFRNRKSHYSVVKTRLSYVNCGNINAISMGPTHDSTYDSFHFYTNVQQAL